MQEVVEEQEIPEANSLMWYRGVHTHTYTYIHGCIGMLYTYVHIYSHIYIYTHVYAHMYIYIYMGGCQNDGPFLGYPRY